MGASVVCYLSSYYSALNSVIAVQAKCLLYSCQSSVQKKIVIKITICLYCDRKTFNNVFQLCFFLLFTVNWNCHYIFFIASFYKCSESPRCLQWFYFSLADSLGNGGSLITTVIPNQNTSWLVSWRQLIKMKFYTKMVRSTVLQRTETREGKILPNSATISSYITWDSEVQGREHRVAF